MLETYEEVMHGIRVVDPYRRLEDRSSPETLAWIAEQRRRSDSYFEDCPGLRLLEARVRSYLDVEEIDQPTKVGETYIYRKRLRGRQQACLCTRINGEEKIIVDPADAGDYASVAIHRIELNGKYLAYEVGQGGEDRREIHIFDLRAGIPLADRIPRGYPRGLSFTDDGYVYCHETGQDDGFHEVRRHIFGDPGPDRVALRVPRSHGSRVFLKADETRFAVIWYLPKSTDIFVNVLVSATADEDTWSPIVIDRKMPFLPLLIGGRLLAITELESKRSHLVELSEVGSELRIIVPEREALIQQVVSIRDRLYVNYVDRGSPRLDCWSLQGEFLTSLNLPTSGSAQPVMTFGQKTDSFFYTIESFDSPPLILEHASADLAPIEWYWREMRTVRLTPQVEEIEVASPDGTRFPMSLVSQGERAPETPGPLILTSYGGFGAALTPKFSVLVTIMMELGVTLALPRIRGGGDFGKAWHEAGRRRNRQFGFDDFIAAAESLCDSGITESKQLAAFGGSNGGLLMGVALTQRPDLFRAILCISPLLDMLRYETFDRAVNWTREYGTVTDPLDFAALYAYSPYHHVDQETDYPATLFVTGDKDDRCNPAHVRKMAAALQNRPAQMEPILVDYSLERGHSPVMPLSVRVTALARRLAFLCRELNISVPEEGCHEEACA